MVDVSTEPERRQRVRGPRPPLHRAAQPVENFTRSFTALGDLAYEGAQVSASVSDLDSGRSLVAIDDRIVLPTASIGKILLLIEVSARLTERDYSGYGILDKTPRDAAGGSGLWQHLQAPSLPVADLAALVGATSDNLATNVLLRQIGLQAVRERTESLGLLRTALLDLVRDSRGPDDAPQLSVGSAAELSWLFAALARGEIIDSLTSSRVLGWLSLNTDFSLVASAFGLDPLSHRGGGSRHPARQQDGGRCRGALRGRRRPRSPGRSFVRRLGAVPRRRDRRASPRARGAPHGRVRSARIPQLVLDPPSGGRRVVTSK